MSPVVRSRTMRPSLWMPSRRTPISKRLAIELSAPTLRGQVPWDSIRWLLYAAAQKAGYTLPTTATRLCLETYSHRNSDRLVGVVVSALGNSLIAMIELSFAKRLGKHCQPSSVSILTSCIGNDLEATTSASRDPQPRRNSPLCRVRALRV